MSRRSCGRLFTIIQTLAGAANATHEGVAAASRLAQGTHVPAAACGSAAAAWVAAMAGATRRYSSHASLVPMDARTRHAKSPLGFPLMGLGPAGSTTSGASVAASGGGFAPSSQMLPATRSVSGGPAASAGGPGEFAKTVGGEAASASTGNAAEGQAQQQQLQQEQQQQQQQQHEGWDGEPEPPPVPLDPNAQTPGMFFVTAGAAISALLAVLIAGLGILGTFYAGYVINEITRELRAASTAAGERGSGGGSGARGATTAGPKLPAPAPATADTARSGCSSSSSSSSPGEAAAGGGAASQPAAAAAVAAGAPQSSAPVGTPAGGPEAPAPARRSWWAWLGLGRWRRQKAGPSEPDQVPAGSG